MLTKTLVRIHHRDLSDTKCHVKLHDQMEINVDEECTIILDNGIELPLDIGRSVTLAFGKPGTYHFEVEYVNGHERSPGGPVRVP